MLLILQCWIILIPHLSHFNEILCCTLLYYERKYWFFSTVHRSRWRRYIVTASGHLATAWYRATGARPHMVTMGNVTFSYFRLPLVHRSSDCMIINLIIFRCVDIHLLYISCVRINERHHKRRANKYTVIKSAMLLLAICEIKHLTEIKVTWSVLL